MSKYHCSVFIPTLSCYVGQFIIQVLLGTTQAKKIESISKIPGTIYFQFSVMLALLVKQNDVNPILSFFRIWKKWVRSYPPQKKNNQKKKKKIKKKEKRCTHGITVVKSDTETKKIQNTQEIKRTLFNWTKQVKTCKYLTKSSFSSNVQHKSACFVCFGFFVRTLAVNSVSEFFSQKQTVNK